MPEEILKGFLRVLREAYSKSAVRSVVKLSASLLNYHSPNFLPGIFPSPAGYVPGGEVVVRLPPI